jgi:CIC family chloride channel protein
VLCLGSSFGGMFSPSLVLGAMVGSAYGIVAHSALPDLGSAVSVYPLAGMGGRRLQLGRRGRDLQTRRDRQLLRATPLAEVMRRVVVTVAQDADPERLKSLFRHRHLPIFVVDPSGRLQGAIAFADFADAVFDLAEQPPPVARDLVHRIPEALLPEDDLETALRLCEANREEHLPVVDNRKDLEVIGEARYHDLVLAYIRALLAARAASAARAETNVAPVAGLMLAPRGGGRSGRKKDPASLEMDARPSKPQRWGSQWCRVRRRRGLALPPVLP